MVRLGKKIRTTRYEVLCMQMNKEGEVLTQARIHIHDSLEEAETAVIADVLNLKSEADKKKFKEEQGLSYKTSYNENDYKALQEQRANERAIRKYKRLESAEKANLEHYPTGSVERITIENRRKEYEAKKRAFQKKQRELIKKHPSLERDYGREALKRFRKYKLEYMNTREMYFDKDTKKMHFQEPISLGGKIYKAGSTKPAKRRYCINESKKIANLVEKVYDAPNIIKDFSKEKDRSFIKLRVPYTASQGTLEHIIDHHNAPGEVNAILKYLKEIVSEPDKVELNEPSKNGNARIKVFKEIDTIDKKQMRMILEKSGNDTWNIVTVFIEKWNQK